MNFQHNMFNQRPPGHNQWGPGPMPPPFCQPNNFRPGPGGNWQVNQPRFPFQNHNQARGYPGPGGYHGNPWNPNNNCQNQYQQPVSQTYNCNSNAGSSNAKSSPMNHMNDVNTSRFMSTSHSSSNHNNSNNNMPNNQCNRNNSFQKDAKSNNLNNRSLPNQGNGGPNSKKNNRNKKKKIDKRDLPENNKFSCDSCDRGFPNEEKLGEHVDGHEQCPKDGCPYIAAPKLVRLHLQMQHKDGMADKIWSTESEEDILKWRAERKRRFPTASNVQQRQTEKNEKLVRGEILQTKTFGNFRNQGKGCKNKRKLEVDTNGEPLAKKYASENVTTLSSTTEKSDNNREEIPRDELDTDSNDVKIDQHAPGVGKKPFQNGRSKKKRGSSKNKQEEHISKKQNTLLEMLLAGEIRHERNILLQCVYYIVKNKFFTDCNTKLTNNDDVNNNAETTNLDKVEDLQCASTEVQDEAMKPEEDCST